MTKGSRRGFTLIELLVTMAVMAILTVITVAQFSTARAKARDVARKGDLNSVSKALGMYFADYGQYPEAVDGRISVDGSTAIAWGEELADKGYVYMKVLPQENSANQPPYCYATDTGRKKIALLSTLENTQDGEYNKFMAVFDPSASYNCNGNSGYHYIYFSPNASKDDFPHL
jgi:prepilin-type N-terminal cleavage/methylation domain-containing protein